MDKKKTRLRRCFKLRQKMRTLRKVRLCVHKTPRHTYAQVISEDGSKVLAQASTLDKSIREQLKQTGNVDAASLVGKIVAERAIKNGVKQVALDRSGFKYQGRIKALADAAREGGLEF